MEKKCNLLCNNTCDHSCKNSYSKKNEDEYSIENIRQKMKNNWESKNVECNTHVEKTFDNFNPIPFKINILLSNELEKFKITSSSYEIMNNNFEEKIEELISIYDDFVINIDGFDPILLFDFRTKRLIELLRTKKPNINIFISSNFKLLTNEMYDYLKENNILLTFRIKNEDINQEIISKISNMDLFSFLEIDCSNDSQLYENIQLLINNNITKIELINLSNNYHKLQELLLLYLTTDNFNIYTFDHMLQFIINKEEYVKDKVYELCIDHKLNLYCRYFDQKVDLINGTKNKFNDKCQNCSLIDFCTTTNIIQNCNYETIYKKLYSLLS